MNSVASLHASPVWWRLQGHHHGNGPCRGSVPRKPRAAARMRQCRGRPTLSARSFASCRYAAVWFRDHPSAVFIIRPDSGIARPARSPMRQLRLNSTRLSHGGDFSGGGNQSTFLVALLVALEESCFAFGSISALGVVSRLRLNARPTRPNATRRLPAIISQCGYSSARSICPHTSRAPLAYRKFGGSGLSAGAIQWGWAAAQATTPIARCGGLLGVVAQAARRPFCRP